MKTLWCKNQENLAHAWAPLIIVRLLPLFVNPHFEGGWQGDLSDLKSVHSNV
jgi:hypothetical protein